MGQLREIHDQLVELGYQILFLSPDRPERVGEVAKKNPYGYTLLSDSKAAAARAFGVAFKVDDKMRARLKGFGIDLEASSGETHHLLPVPSVFIFGGGKTVDFSYVNPDYTVRIDPLLLLAAARSVKK